MYGSVVKTASKKTLSKFMREHISKGAQIRTDGWAGYKGLNVCISVEVVCRTTTAVGMVNSSGVLPVADVLVLSGKI